VPVQAAWASSEAARSTQTVFDVFMPCASGIAPYLAAETQRVADAASAVDHAQPIGRITTLHGGISLRATWEGVMRLNLHSRLAQRVLIELTRAPYRSEDDLYAAVYKLRLLEWFTPQDSFRIDVTARHSPLQSLNFAALRIKDAVVDRFRADCGQRPNVDRDRPAVRLHAHLEADHLVLSIDTSGEPLFKRGWRDDTGDAPLKETLAAAMLAACGWDPLGPHALPLYDPCCGSGTIAIEAALIASRTPPGMQRRFGFERLHPHQAAAWVAIKNEAASAVVTPQVAIFGSDVSHRMVDFAQRNAERAGVAPWVQFRGGDALQRMPPAERGVMVLNPPYGERIGVGGHMRGARSGRERMVMPASPTPDDASSAETAAFFNALAAHWKAHFGGWQAWLLSPDAQLPAHLRLKPRQRIPMFNGPIECRLMGFELTARKAA
jgi:putative N6-adenine-specific DNA methylase